MKPFQLVLIITAALVTLIMLLAGVLYYSHTTLSEKIETLGAQIKTNTETQDALNSSFETQLVAIGNALTSAQSENQQLLSVLQEEQKTVARTLEREIERVTDTVGDLEKLSKTDPRLLQKYSKIFFLNEHYTPGRLTPIPKPYLYHEDQNQQFLSEAWPFLKELLDDAKRAGVTLYIKSAYRSFDEQRNIKGTFSVLYGEGTANTFSADQGYSEHQLGTAVDFMTTGLGGQLVEAFDQTPAYTWLANNAHKYGFILSYPKGNTYYIYEPWHWRFVGKELASALKRQGKHFYDLDQREIDEYLISLFED